MGVVVYMGGAPQGAAEGFSGQDATIRLVQGGSSLNRVRGEMVSPHIRELTRPAFVSPYLTRPIRPYWQALAEITRRQLVEHYRGKR